MHRALFALPLILSLAAAPAARANTCTGKTGEAGTFTVTLQSGGIDRDYILTVPPTYDRRLGSPLVFNLHGLGSNAADFAAYTGMDEAGADAGFIVVHPDGFENSWNAGSCCGAAASQGIDDVQFVRDMITRISAEYCIDPDRIHATGFSNGGYMSHRLACEAGDVIASVAPVSGVLGVDCSPARPVALHQTHGTADPLVWYQVGYNDVFHWADLDGCDETPTTYYDRSNVECIRYENCPDGIDVELCSLRFVGHRWYSSRAYDTTQANLRFFETHPMP